MATNNTVPTEATTSEVTPEQREANLKAAVEGGHAKYVTKTVSVQVPGKKDPVKKEAQFYVALDIEGALAYCDGREKPEYNEDGDEKRGVLSLIGQFNYATDLTQRGPIRTQILAENEGPAKTIDKAAKALAIALGIPEAEARAQVVEARKAKGLPVDDPAPEADEAEPPAQG